MVARGRLFPLLAAALVLATSPPLAGATETPTLLVTYFDNHTGDATYDPLGRGLADMVVTDLTGVTGLRIVERARLQALLDELALQGSAAVEAATAQEQGRLLGASHAVTGSVTAVKPDVRIDIRMVSVGTGEVLLADSVTGRADRFFELQAELTRRFVEGLGKEPAGGVPATQVAQLASVLAYARGLEQADTGDLEGASKTLGGVVTDEPTFQLAATRHADVVRALYEARQQRTTALGGLADQLQARVDAELAGPDLATLDFEAANRRVGYRVLAGNIRLGRIRGLLGPANGEGRRPIPDGARDDILALMRGYVDNTEAYLDGMQRWWAAHPDCDEAFLDGEISDEDAALAERANLGDAGNWDFATPNHAANGLAEFILMGSPDYYGDIEFVVTPTLAQADPGYREKGYGLLAFALAQAQATADPDDAIDAGVKTLYTWGEALRFEGRNGEAIARWQMILDRYPTSEDYATIEQKILNTLAREP
jgi:TolB-like protein